MSDLLISYLKLILYYFLSYFISYDCHNLLISIIFLRCFSVFCDVL